MILLRLPLFLLRSLLAALMAITTGNMAYNILNPRQVIADSTSIYLGIAAQIDALLKGLPAPSIGPDRLYYYLTQPPDFAQLFVLIGIAFFIFGAIYSLWRWLPLTLILTIPIFEATRYYVPPVTYSGQAFLLWLLELGRQPVFLISVAVILFWVLFSYGYLIYLANWRWVALCAAVSIAVVTLVSFWPPVQIAFNPFTSRHHGMVWLISLSVVWALLVTMARLVFIPARPVAATAPNNLTFDEAYRRARERRQR